MESAKILKGELLLQDDGEKKSREVELFMTIFNSHHFDSLTYIEVCGMTCTRLTLFNGRRGGEPC